MEIYGTCGWYVSQDPVQAQSTTSTSTIILCTCPGCIGAKEKGKSKAGSGRGRQDGRAQTAITDDLLMGDGEDEVNRNNKIIKRRDIDEARGWRLRLLLLSSAHSLPLRTWFDDLAGSQNRCFVSAHAARESE